MTLQEIKDSLIVELSNDMEGNFLELLTMYHALCTDFHNKEFNKEIGKAHTLNERLIYDNYRLAFSFFAAYYPNEFSKLSNRSIVMFLAIDNIQQDKTAFEICKDQVFYAHKYFERQRHDDICIRAILNSLGWLMWKEEVNVSAIILHYSNTNSKETQGLN